MCSACSGDYENPNEFDGNEEDGGVPCEGNGERLLTESPSNIQAQQVADAAARRTARASWANTKMLMKAMGIDA